jgi:hypothetical protein
MGRNSVPVTVADVPGRPAVGETEIPVAADAEGEGLTRMTRRVTTRVRVSAPAVNRLIPNARSSTAIPQIRSSRERSITDHSQCSHKEFPLWAF